MRMLRQEGGFGLVELMVGLLIGLIVTAAAITIFVSTKKSYTLQEDLGRIQENARFALEFIKYDFRMAGYYGCADDPTAVFNHVDGGAGSIFDTSKNVEGVNNTDPASSQWLPSNSTDGISSIRSGTDAITIRSLGSGSAQVLEPFMPNVSAALHLSSGHSIEEGDIVAVTDCYSTDIFQVTSINDVAGGKSALNHNTGVAGVSPGNAEKDFSKTYEGDAQIRSFQAVRYYIGTGQNGGPALMRQVIKNTTGTAAASAEEMVEGVEDMQILYGVDNTGSSEPDTYVTASNVGATNWDKVRSIQIALLIRSIDEYGPGKDDRTYTMLDQTFNDPSDERRRRRVFSTTILARNL